MPQQPQRPPSRLLQPGENTQLELPGTFTHWVKADRASDEANWALRPTSPQASQLEWENGLHNNIPEGTNVHDPNRCPTCGRPKNPGSDFCPICYTPYDQAPDPQVQKAWGWHPTQYPDHIPLTWIKKHNQNELIRLKELYKGKGIKSGYEASETLASPQMHEWLAQYAPQEAMQNARWKGQNALNMVAWRNLTHQYSPFDVQYEWRKPSQAPPATFTGRVVTSWFQNGDPIRPVQDVWGQDRDGNNFIVPKGMPGTVIWSDPEETIASFDIEINGPLQPMTIRVQDDTDLFVAAPKSQPGFRRR